MLSFLIWFFIFSLFIHFHLRALFILKALFSIWLHYLLCHLLCLLQSFPSICSSYCIVLYLSIPPLCHILFLRSGIFIIGFPLTVPVFPPFYLSPWPFLITILPPPFLYSFFMHSLNTSSLLLLSVAIFFLTLLSLTYIL